MLGPIVFGQDALVYLSFAALFGVSWFLYRSHAGLVLRAVGDSHDAAHAIGYKVTRIRYLAVAFGGAMCGIAGSYLSLVYTPMWAENMTSGRGWIALALVVFATWRPARLAARRLSLRRNHHPATPHPGLGHRHSLAIRLDAALYRDIAVLVAISSNRTRVRLNTPACLGQPFHATT